MRSGSDSRGAGSSRLSSGYATTRDASSSSDDKSPFAVLEQAKNWLQENAMDHIVLPIVMMVVRLSFFLFTSVGVYTLMYLYLMPRALVQEPIYFDYGTSPPTASLNLLSAHKQWEYIRGGLKAGANLDNADASSSSNNFLRSDFAYSLDVAFTLSKSQRNFELGKFMANIQLVDNTGDLVAKSSRPVVMPYQSPVTLFMDSVAKFPCRVVGLCAPSEVVTVHVPMMTEYREPKATSTESIELTLSSDTADISAVEVTIMPVLKGLIYFMWYYPMLTGLACISTVMCLQLGIYGLYLLGMYLGRYLVELGNDDNGDNGDIGGGGNAVPPSEAGGEEDDDDAGTSAPRSSSIGGTSAGGGGHASSSSSGTFSGSSASSSSSSSPDGDSDDGNVLLGEGVALSEGTASVTHDDMDEGEVEAVLISESSNNNNNLRRRVAGRAAERELEQQGERSTTS